MTKWIIALFVFCTYFLSACTPVQFEQLTDTNLAALINKHKYGLIYVWSEAMPLSYQALASIKEVAKENKLPLIITHDPGNRTKLDHESLALQSNLLITKGATLHYPSVLMFKNKKILKRIKYGYETKDGFRQYLKEAWP